MEGLIVLRDRFLKFRFSGMLVVAVVFAVISFILFLERSGISYNYNNPKLEFIPEAQVITKAEALAPLAKKTVVLWDSTQADSVQAMEDILVSIAD